MGEKVIYIKRGLEGGDGEEGRMDGRERVERAEWIERWRGITLIKKRMEGRKQWRGRV